MVRRSFRIGLRLGLLFGVVAALVKTVQSRRTAAAVPPPAPWEPIVDTPRSAAAPERDAEPVPVPAVPDPPADDEPLVDEVGEPIMEPAPAIDHDPALDIIPEPTEVTAPVKKVAAKKLPAAKKATAPRKAVAKKAAKKAAADAPAGGAPFVDPEDGVCPTSHPVKAKLTSRLFHLPGMFAYDRTRPDRCYRDADAAVADGFTQAKR